MEITRAEGTGRFLKRFDFIAREISGFGSETSLRKNGEKGKRGQSPVSHMTFGLPIHFVPPGFRFYPFPVRPVALFFLYIEKYGEGRLHSRRMANWTRNFILPDERPPTPGKLGKVSGRMQYSRQPGRQRMSSAHESGYPNEIQYGNVEDHLIVFARVLLLPTKIRLVLRYHLRLRSFHRIAVATACCAEFRQDF